MKRLLLCLMLAVMAASMTSCATSHLWRWGLGKTSAVHQVEDDDIAAFIKPSATVLGSPIAIAWDVFTLPFQMGFQVYPYFGQDYMQPSARPE